jgi:hypothetical protein
LLLIAGEGFERPAVCKTAGPPKARKG